MNSNQTRVTLEDLLRVKRAEQPPTTFWSDFEREMRAKQLAAIVEPRPWWAPLIRVSARLSHYNLPIGAAAVLALSFISVTGYRSIDSRVAPRTQIGVAATAPRVVSPVAVAVPVTEHLAATTAVETNAGAPEEAVAATDVSTELGQVSHAEPLLDAAAIEPTPSARYIAANLAAAQAADPRIMDDVFGHTVRTVSDSQPMRDPLAQLAAPGESRRSRLMESALPAVANGGDVAVGTSDRVARRLTEERLYDTIRRVGLQGDRVAIKF